MIRDKLCKHCKQSFPNTIDYMNGTSCIQCHRMINVSLKGAQERAKINNRSYNLDANWIHEQLFKQDYRCWWTGQAFDFSETIIPNIANPNVISIDRLNNEEGYTKENSVLCVNWFNKLKSDYSIPELNHILMGCVSAYAKLQQYFVPYSSQPINQAIETNYQDQFEMPLTEAEMAEFLKKLDNDYYDRMRTAIRKAEGLAKLLEDIENSPSK
ncbi:hypothetical protein [Bacillus cereus]|uniref:hypothetical protein n=2 Tax=Bacillus cereus group TaxID=86661 RepID=UPI0005CE12C7|nr:hypothetical protein [Bacillus cereus]